MEKIDKYLALPYRLEIVPDPDEGGFIASYPELPGCITCGATINEAVANALDAKQAWLEAAIESNTSINEPEDIERYSGQFKLRMPKSLHKSLAEHSKAEKVSMNQYCLYLLTKYDAIQNQAVHFIREEREPYGRK